MSGGLRISCFDACALQEDDTRRFWTKPLGRYFNPRPPCGGRRRRRPRPASGWYFNPHPPCGGRLQPRRNRRNQKNFNPRPPCGGRQSIQDAYNGFANFNPRPPCGGRPHAHGSSAPSVGSFQSTSSVRRTTRLLSLFCCVPTISIHVLRAEDDPGALMGKRLPPISIHVLRAEDDEHCLC